MGNFTPKLLRSRHAILSGTPGDISIEILLAPFLWEADIVDTSIRLDGIDLPSNMLQDLAGKAFEFPLNPEEGYIDGSVYLDGAHHPVDVSALHFSRSRDGHLTLIVKGVYVFEAEGLGDLPNSPFTLAATVSSCAI